MLILSLVFVDNPVNAQVDSIKVANKRNEVGLNIGPVILVMLGGTPYSQPIGITHKKIFKKWGFRSNFTFKPIANSIYESYSEKIQTNDTTLFMRTTNRNNKSYIGRIGVEYRHRFKCGWHFVGGIDLQAQHSVDNTNITEAVFRIDSISNYGTAQQSYNTAFKEQNSLYDEKIISKHVGLDSL